MIWIIILFLYLSLKGYNQLAESPWGKKLGLRHNADLVKKSRPAFHGVERYDKKHRFRPAASPVIKQVDRHGNVKVKGEYHNL